MDKIYSTLPEETQTTIDAIVSRVRDNVTNNGIVDLDLLLATLEQLNEVKKETKELYKKIEKEQIAEKTLKAKKIGKAYAATLSEGDMITFVYGVGGCKTATLPLIKIGAATVQVEYTPDMLGPGSTTSKRNIHYDKIVVPEDFIRSFTE